MGMTNKEIIKAVITHPRIKDKNITGLTGMHEDVLYVFLERDEINDKKENIELYIARAMFMNHNFAKAFWGEEEIYSGTSVKLCPECERKECERMVKEAKPRWEYELQQMVLEENPLKYLEEFL